MFVENCSSLKFRFLWLTIGYILVAVVTYLSLTTNPVDTGVQIPFIDKFFHALAYFTLMFWFAQIYHRNNQRFTIVIIFVAMGLLFEYIQSFDPNRFAEIGDMVANSFGVLLGFVVTKNRGKNILLLIESRAL